MLQLMKPHTGGQRALYLHPARFQVVACGRRWGKTAFGKLWLLEGLIRQGVPCWWVAPTYKMSGEIWREFQRTFGKFVSWQNATDRVMEFSNGASLTVWTGKAHDTMRGGAPGRVVIDEAAMIPTDELWYGSVLPALTDRDGSALFLSTPRGRNWFWELFNRGNDPLQQNLYKSWNFPSWFNPRFSRSYFETLRLSTPELFFRQEYEAEFVDDAGGVFRGVTKVATLDEAQPYAGDFVMGVDWGKSNDFTAISVIDRASKKQVALERFNQIGWSLQRGRLRTMYDRWKPAIIYAEANSIGDPNIEALRQEGLPVQAFYTTAQSKPPLIEALTLAIERQQIMLLNDRVQTAELQAYEMTRRADGQFRYSAPDGGHDDTVIATALAWHGCAQPNLFLFDKTDDE